MSGRDEDTAQYRYLQHRIGGGIAADDGYWQALEDGAFRLPRCAGCGRWTWPAHWRCGQCGSWDFDWIDVNPVGVIYAWTRARQAYAGVDERRDQVPYVTALVEIDGTDETRVLGVLKGDEAGLKIGVRVHGEIDPPSAIAKGYASIRWVIERGDR
ncbi:MAG: Zn-ribbon domain-containing OB-fold protein [Desertimonas sp.]